ncbi:MAG: Major facilitator superfamily 1, partial [Microbacteriaceae bacterium]|nr:Major facilitator superfamily 1 [Microbacteriaceae bacterium]
MGFRLFGAYADILSNPGTVRFVVAGWFGRISRSTTGIATILLVASYTNSYALAGAVAGAIVIGVGVAGPLWSRALDARGQTAVLPISLVAAV